MTAPARVSIIIVSRHRPAALLRCITALRQQDHPAIELVVVADPAAADLVRGMPVKLAGFDEANISAARNLGLALAAAPVVAFIDDDAAAEPTWVRRLTAAFADPRVTAAGGFVRGRNGFSFQWQAVEVDWHGQDHTLPPPARTTRHAGSAACAVKTQGTNCAFRRDDLLAIGGFDPALRFFLDEADVNLRLAARGGLTAIVPGAEVHHGFAASALRRADRAPRDLTEIGASQAVFLRRHAPAPHAATLAALVGAQRRRLLAMMVAGLLEPRDVGRLLATLQAGIAEGLARPLPPLAPLSPDFPPFVPLPGTGPRPARFIAGRPWSVRRQSAQATRAVADGAVVTLITLGPSARFHTLRFDPRGFWWQNGGVAGQSDRAGPLIRVTGFTWRQAVERKRLEHLRTDHEDSAGT